MIHLDPSESGPAPRPRPARPVSFLPGPVAVHATVHEAFTRPAVSHRAAAFLEEIRRVRGRLRELTGAQHVQVLLGSGTLANDAVAAQLSLRKERGERGIVLTNGEFGDRLAGQARRFGLEPSVLEAGWGEALPYERARRALTAGRFHWLWAVHCETSTGVLNDLERLKGLAREGGVGLCLDAISSLGTVPVDLDGVDLASGVSGKGLASYPGLSFVFHQDPIEPSPSLPSYLDLGLYARSPATPFTASSNLLQALSTSLDRAAALGTSPRRADLARRLRPRLEALGFTALAPLALASPAVLSLLPPPPWRAFALGEALDERGFLLGYRSEYLERRNLIQVCLMGEHSLREGEAFLAALTDLLAPR